MKAAILAIALLGFGALAAGSAGAQIAPGQSGKSSASYLGRSEVWRSFERFGSCTAQKRTEQAWALIATTPGSKEESKALSALQKVNSACPIDFEIKTWVANLRGAIAEGLLERGIAVPASAAFNFHVPEGSARTLDEGLVCFAARHPRRIRALAAETVPGSPEELAAVRAMLPDLKRCAPGGILRGKLNATFIRFWLVEIVLRLSPAASGGGA